MMNGCTVVLILLFIFMEGGIVVGSEWSNVGTVLFSHHDLSLRHWPKERVALLQARRYVQDLIPPPDYLVSDVDYVQTTLKYFRDGYATIKSVSPDHETNSIMTTALSDAVGGFLKIYVLPLTKLDFYAGTVSFEDSTKLTSFYNEVKNYLNTNGSGWHNPSNNQISNIFRRAPRMRRKQHAQENPNPDPCNCFAYLQKVDSGLTVPLPSINWEDGTMFIPFKNQTTFSLESPKYYNSLNNYYINAKSCVRNMGEHSEREFDQRFQYWLLKDVIPRLSDDHLYVALGNVLSMVNQSNPFIESKIRIQSNSYPPQYVTHPPPRKDKLVVVEHKPCGLAIIDRLIHSKRLIIIAIIIITEIIWCILVFKHLFYRKPKDCKDQSCHMDAAEKGIGSRSMSKCNIVDKCLSRQASKTRYVREKENHCSKTQVNDVTVTRFVKTGSVADIKGGGIKLYKNPHDTKTSHLGTQYSAKMHKHSQGVNTKSSVHKQKKVEINIGVMKNEGETIVKDAAAVNVNTKIRRDKKVQSDTSESDRAVKQTQSTTTPTESVKDAATGSNTSNTTSNATHNPEQVSPDAYSNTTSSTTDFPKPCTTHVSRARTTHITDPCNACIPEPCNAYIPEPCNAYVPDPCSPTACSSATSNTSQFLEPCLPDACLAASSSTTQIQEQCSPVVPGEPCTCVEELLKVNNMDDTNDACIVTDTDFCDITNCDNILDDACPNVAAYDLAERCAAIENANQPGAPAINPQKIAETLALLRHSERSMKDKVYSSPRDVKKRQKQGFKFEVLSASFPPSTVRVSEMCTCVYHIDNACPCTSCKDEPSPAIDNVVERQESLSCKTCRYDATGIITEKKTSGTTTETKTLLMHVDGQSTTMQGVQEKQTIHVQKEIYVTNKEPPSRIRKPYVEIQIQKPRHTDIKLGIVGMRTKVETTRRGIVSKIPMKAMQTLEYSHVSEPKHYKSPRDSAEEYVRISKSARERSTVTKTKEANTETVVKTRTLGTKSKEFRDRSEPCTCTVDYCPVKEKSQGILKFKRKRAKIVDPLRHSSTKVYLVDNADYLPQTLMGLKQSELPMQEAPKQSELLKQAEQPTSPKPRSPEGQRRSFIPKLKKSTAADDTEIRSRKNVSVTDSKLNLTL